MSDSGVATSGARTIQPVVALVGPTASGKSGLGLRIAAELGGEIVNADASQLYRGMDIGTAKLSTAQRQGIAHHQIDVLEVADEARVAAYQRWARQDLAAIRARGACPLVVGGSGLYVRALLDQLDIPPTDPGVRAHWEAVLAERGADALHAELAGRDPVAAARLDARNERRVVRALEVIELTGRPFSASMPRREYVEPTVMIGLTADREVLSARIAERVESMWEAGLLDEVRGLAAMGLRESPTARRALGYSQALAHLDGRLRAEQARADTAIATRQYARRQMAWFRADPRITWLAHDAPDLLPQALAAITERHQES
ncbi:MAG: tRNA (adenosine(37)-N6)-dimethylallyltransferase MiaA [Ornithinimicrobium sp.]